MVASVDREEAWDLNDIYFMPFALKGKVLKINKEKAINTCGHGHYLKL